ncbi:hypothetical protein ACFVHI_35485 [Kitasatospora sp. NPDC127121]|uniref:hypothetical protein n=1 Tax=Kitasatospora sp. NPDC127121 TaxID=3345371 RepID=UPI00364456FC
MDNHLAESLAVHAEALAAWRECRTKAQQIEDPEERAAALADLATRRPVHPYFGGLSLTALRRGNRRMLAPVRARHADAKAEHAETLAAWKKRHSTAQQIEDPEKRDAALDALKRERPTHPVLVATGCAVVAAVVLAGIPAVRHYAGVVVTSGLTLWVIVALILGNTTAPEKTPKALTEKVADAPADDADEDQEEEPETTVPTPAETHLLTASLAAGGTSVLLTRLAIDLAASHPSWEPSTKAVRTLLSEAGIRVRDGVRTPDGNGPGVHHEDVPPLPSPSESAPLPGVVANVGAGQSANANANNTIEAPAQEGFITVPHPTEPNRTIVVHAA